MGVRVGGLGASVGGRGGGGMEKDGGLGGAEEEEEGCRALDTLDLSSPESVNVGTAWFRVVAEALGVVSGEDGAAVDLGAAGRGSGGGGMDSPASLDLSCMLPPS
jgi:hypothetical protein